MTWNRFINRNKIAHLSYEPRGDVSLLAGDAGRLAENLTDELHVWMIARMAGVSEEVAGKIVRAIFNAPEPNCSDCLKKRGMIDQRCELHRIGGAKTIDGSEYVHRCREMFS